MSILPDDVIEAILSRLPVKSLHIFKCVSKSWKSMIPNPYFIRTYHNLSINSHSQNLFIQHSHDKFSLVRLQDRKFKTEAVLERPYAMFCGADNMVLLHATYEKSYPNFHLYSPCTCQNIIIRFPYNLQYYPTIRGMCNDQSNNDFKVVLGSDNFYAVYSCKNKTWTEKKEFIYDSSSSNYAEVHGNEDGLSVDGAIYWVWTQTVGKISSGLFILFFDRRDDEFKIMPKPKVVDDDVIFLLTSLRGCLSLYGKTRDNRIKLWIKEKGGPEKDCWELLMNIESMKMPPGFLVMLPFLGNKAVELLVILPFVENKILVAYSGLRFRIYDIFEHTYEEVEEEEGGMGFLFPCVDSLFFPVTKTRHNKRKRSRYSLLD